MQVDNLDSQDGDGDLELFELKKNQTCSSPSRTQIVTVNSLKPFNETLLKTLTCRILFYAEKKLGKSCPQSIFDYKLTIQQNGDTIR